jgi:uncharacterized protein (DUF1810 family)
MNAADPADPHNLRRFVEAQAGVFAQALAELRGGRKTTHWIWYVFPQVAGLGASAMSQRYAIGSTAEGRAYLAHATLGPRLVECTSAMNALTGLSAVDVLGSIDARKFQSSMTLFARLGGERSVFDTALDKYFAGSCDDATIAFLQTLP